MELLLGKARTVVCQGVVEAALHQQADAVHGKRIATAERGIAAHAEGARELQRFALGVEVARRQRAIAAEVGRRTELERAKAFGLFGLQRNGFDVRSEEHTSELQSLMRISYAVSCEKQQ